MKATLKTTLAAVILLAISCSKEQLHTKSSEMVKAEDNSALETTSHYIGEHFGGGIIFYLDSTGKHGLIADTVDLGEFKWLNEVYTVTGATPIRISSGFFNTREIIQSQDTTGSYAALVCGKSRNSGYKDWFMPSRNELGAMYKQKDLIGGIEYDGRGYWSSSESNINDAWGINFNNGLQGIINKKAIGKVRAIRAF